MKQILSFFTWMPIFCLLISSPHPSHSQTGQPLTAWSPGLLDIHHINTGKGECIFCILPDGTTLLIDAGATTRPKPRVTDPKPDGSRAPGEWITRYITKTLSFTNKKSIEYALLSHFHGDHMGTIDQTSKPSKTGAYKLSGITEVGDALPFKTLLDRDYPDYDYPEPLNSPTMDNYKAFMDYHQAENGLRVEKFVPGRRDQLVLVNNPNDYPDFAIQNIACNGEIWTGVGTSTRHLFPPLDELDPREFPSENMCSIALRISYGAFDYFTGGDIIGVLDEGDPLWQDVETEVAKAVGPVEVNELNHHGYLDSENAFFLSALRPQVHIIQAWSPSHPSPRVLRRLLSTQLYPGPRDIFSTNMMEANKIVIGGNLEKLKSDQGHIVIRVAPGGETYKVIILDDSNESHQVKAVFGDYASR